MLNNVLVVDNDRVMQRTLTSLLQSEGGFLNVLAATDGSQAMAVLRKMPIQLVITAIRVPAIDGFELVARLARDYPATRVIVMTSESTPLLRARIKQFPSAVYLDQNQDLSRLTKRVFTELQIDYGGRVRGINLTSFLQMLALEMRTCTLKVSSKDQAGFLWMEAGELIHASLGEEQGKDAALTILTWRNIFIDIDYTPRQVTKTIHEPLMMLILESGQLDDELRSASANQRSHKRYELLVALDFDIQQMTRHCSLRDISLGGAYVETDHLVEIGEVITLSLNSPQLRASCSVDATVVRKDRGGIGVRFQLAGPQQSDMIKSLIGASLQPPRQVSDKGDPASSPGLVT